MKTFEEKRRLKDAADDTIQMMLAKWKPSERRNVTLVDREMSEKMFSVATYFFEVPLQRQIFQSKC